ncbi:SET domain-containing protein [Trichoderma citrinoviride]|uniref:SET domain-containing protein n=1 Tax=Trichoderma citrinoviride TaxID=58853 RepID=A0A2T4BKF8_9HYPO|nr:SET domain-containing protein [Trichoderma citrinoviride]PTB69793.1 SET domain-containing protein [Trichoderma citrinoviride]
MAQLPIEAFPAWALLNNVDFANAEIRNIEGKGFGLVTKNDITNEGREASGAAPILRIPRDLVLSAEAVEEYAKVDQNFKQLLDVAGHRSTRDDIMLYLLTRLVQSKATSSGTRAFTSTPWTEYIKFLPRPIPVPTMWTNDERELLKGTSLEAAVSAKLSTLSSEFDELCEQASALPFWNALLNESATLEDWTLADAWYRSRCLELPRSGHAMVPGLDMANHSQSHSAYYDESSDGDVVLLPRPGSKIHADGEITISYGEAKSAAEMLFSYGFIDTDSPVKELTLHLDALPDDPLGRAKFHIYKGPPTVRLSITDNNVHWSSPFLYLLILNEEDGLAFRVLQDTTGGRQLKLFWQDEDVTERTGEFETLVQNHPLHQVFKLRAVAVLEERVAMQLDRISSGPSYGAREQSHAAANEPRAECRLAAETLRDLETQVLQGVAHALENEKARLLLDADVVTYLGSMEDAQNEQAPGPASNDDDEFS